VTLTAWENSRSMYHCAGTMCKDLAIYPGELVRFRRATREPLCQDCGGGRDKAPSASAPVHAPRVVADIGEA